MIDLLSTHDDYETELVRLLERPENPYSTRSRTQRTWGLGAVGNAASWLLGIGLSQSTSNKSRRPDLQYKDRKLPRIDDATFLTELCVLRDERPAYAQIAEEIIREATESLGVKLKRVSKDIAPRAEREMGRRLQEISSLFTEQRLHAEETSRLELRDLVRRDLDEEPRHPDDLYDDDSSQLSSIALTPRRTRLVIRKVIVDNSSFSSE